MGRPLRSLAGLVAAVAVLGAVVLLRDATQSTHEDQHPDSRLEIVLDADTRPGAESTLEAMTGAQVASCTPEVGARPAGPLEVLPDDPTRFRIVLRPALDDTDETQLRGCLQDWRIDHLRVRVLSMTRSGA